MDKGRKYTCAKCGTKYYDLGKADHPRPKCGNATAEKNTSKYKKPAVRGKKGGFSGKPGGEIKNINPFQGWKGAIQRLALMYTGALLI